METIEILQNYWWLIISVLGAALVFLLFVQGGQSMLCHRLDNAERQLMVNSLGRKWEFTYTTLVVFGGAFFASFPLFYSTSFGGAYWLWMLILVSFVLQAVSYEFRRKKGNVYGTATYDAFLMFNGLAGCVLLGVAVGTFFNGGAFTVNFDRLLQPGSPVISQWAPTHGLEAIADWHNLLLGFAVFFLARTLAAMYFVNNIGSAPALTARMRRQTLVNGIVFAALFVAFLAVTMLQTGYRADSGTGLLVAENNIYLHNLLGAWWLTAIFLLAVVAVLAAVFGTAFGKSWRGGIWLGGIGVIAAVCTLFLIAAAGGTAYLPSNIDPQSSLTLANSSSSLFTLTVMAWASLLIPFVIAYIWYTWRKINARPLTAGELSKESHNY